MQNRVDKLPAIIYLRLQIVKWNLQSENKNFEKKRARTCVYEIFFVPLRPILNWLSVAIEQSLCKIFVI